eukprot:UN0204
MAPYSTWAEVSSSLSQFEEATVLVLSISKSSTQLEARSRPTRHPCLTLSFSPISASHHGCTSKSVARSTLTPVISNLWMSVSFAAKPATITPLLSKRCLTSSGMPPSIIGNCKTYVLPLIGNPSCTMATGLSDLSSKSLSDSQGP